LYYADVLVGVLLVTVLELEHCHNYSVSDALKNWNNLNVSDFFVTYIF